MPKGRKTPAPKDVSDFDLLALRPELEAVRDGRASVLWGESLMTLGRIIEGIAIQNRHRVSEKKRKLIDDFVNLTLDHIILVEGALLGSRETIDHLLHRNMIDDIGAVLADDSATYLNERFKQEAARQALNLIDKIDALGSKRSAGRPVGSGGAQIDVAALNIIAQRADAKRLSRDEMLRSIRGVISEGIASGMLPFPARGNDSKESIDTHAKRLRARAQRVFGTTSD